MGRGRSKSVTYYLNGHQICAYVKRSVTVILSHNIFNRLCTKKQVPILTTVLNMTEVLNEQSGSADHLFGNPVPTQPDKRCSGTINVCVQSQSKTCFSGWN